MASQHTLNKIQTSFRNYKTPRTPPNIMFYHISYYFPSCLHQTSHTHPCCFLTMPGRLPPRHFSTRCSLSSNALPLDTDIVSDFLTSFRTLIKCRLLKRSFLTTLSKIVPLSHCIFLLTLLHNTYFLTWLWNICLFTCLLIVSPLKFKFCLDRFLVIFFYFYNPSA